jgi:hypothetical protein
MTQVFVWGRAPREPALSEVEGSKPSKARQLPWPKQLWVRYNVT